MGNTLWNSMYGDRCYLIAVIAETNPVQVKYPSSVHWVDIPGCGQLKRYEQFPGSTWVCRRRVNNWMVFVAFLYGWSLQSPFMMPASVMTGIWMICYVPIARCVRRQRLPWSYLSWLLLLLENYNSYPVAQDSYGHHYVANWSLILFQDQQCKLWILWIRRS